MKTINIKEMVKLKNSDTNKSVFIEIVLKGKDCGGVSGVLGPHTQGPYHFHKIHECVFFVLSGEAIEKIEGKEYPLTKEVILYIPAGEKHQMINQTDKEFHYFEIQIPAPDMSDVFDVK